jgi:hypothetical protein
MPDIGWEDEPQQSGAVVAVHYGDYRRQELWTSSGSSIGNWICLGGEFGRPKPWDDPRSEMEKMLHRRDTPAPAPGPNEIPRHPTWEHVLARGPVTILSAGDPETYATGTAGRRAKRDGRRRCLKPLPGRTTRPSTTR